MKTSDFLLHMQHPTKKTLETNYTVMQWKPAHLEKKKTLGRPSQYGWVWNNKNRVYDPMMTEPESIAELSIVNAIPVAWRKNASARRTVLYVPSYAIAL